MEKKQVFLPIPNEVLVADSAIELARVWAVDGGQYVSLATGIWKDPAAWGLMLVDLAQHIALAYEKNANIPKEIALVAIKAAFDAEWMSPTA